MSSGDVVQRLGFVSLGVHDLDAAVDFYSRVGQLAVSERGADTVFLTGGIDHHWLRLHTADRAGTFRLGYEVVDAAALDTIADRLAARGIPHHPGGDLSQDRLDRTLVFQDPDGLEVELFTQMVELPVSPAQSIVNMERLLHTVWLGSTAESGFDFYSQVLGFKPSDWIERLVVFMRCANRFHHVAGVALGGPAAGRLDHFCILVDGIDDVMRARNNGLAAGAVLRQDLCRHAASGSIGVYFVEPQTGIGLEFCTEHGQIDDEGHRARIMPAGPVTVDVWLQQPPELAATVTAPPPVLPQPAGPNPAVDARVSANQR
jgi:catechol 2,3-dioxygenase-like lactoylglutathione lyase family enzyme